MKGRRTTLAWLSACVASCACSVYDDTLRSFQGVTPGGALGAGGDIAAAMSGGAGSTSSGGEPSVAGHGGVAAGSSAGGSAASAGRAGGGAGGGGGATQGGAGGIGPGGEAGAAGAPEPDPPSCDDLPVPLKGSWKASASHSSLGVGEELYNPPDYVMDLSLKRWSTGKIQAGDEWLQVDLGATAAVRELTFTLRPDDAEDYPRSYEIVISDEPLNQDGLPAASGVGALGQTLVVSLPELVVGRFVLVKQKGKDPLAWWSVAELSARCY